MAAVKAYKEHRALAGGEEMVTIEYDFAKDGGAVGALDLLQVKEKTVLVDGWVEVLTTFTSGGSATLIVGRTGDTDAIVAGPLAVASITAGTVHTDAAAVKKALAADDKILMTIGTAAMTAGRMRVVLKLKKLA